MLVFSSAQFGQEAFTHWREAISSRFVPLRPELVHSGADFFAELRGHSVGDVTLTDIRSTGQRVYHLQREITRSRGETFFLNLQVAGRSGLLLDDRSVATQDGDFFFVDSRRPFTLACETPMRHICLALPRSALADRLIKADRAHGLVVPRTEGLSTLLRDYLCSLSATGEALENAEVNEIAQHLIALVAHVIARRQASEPAPLRAVRAAQFAKAQLIIDRRLSDSTFSPAALAREAGVSLRYLQLVYAEHETSPMHAITQRRAHRALQLLRDCNLERRTIAEIAFACGFRDLSHFGRTIVKLAGQTPSEIRRAAHQASDTSPIAISAALTTPPKRSTEM